MMLDYLKPVLDTIAIRRWNRNGNHPTLDAYPRSLPTHLEVEINGKRFYLVRGFPGKNVHDEVWHRPEVDTPNPIPGCQLITDTSRC